MEQRSSRKRDADIGLAVFWCVNAKNALHNVHGFSPYQLTLGTNPKLPSTLSDILLALTNKPISKVTSQNLEAYTKHEKHSLQLRTQKE